MTAMWKRIAIGAAIVATVGTITLVARPGRLLAAGMMSGNTGGMMQSAMMSGDMSSMMQDGHMDGDMSSMMKDGHMGGMMQGMMGGDMSKMHESMSGMHDKYLSAAAGALGMTADELNQALAAGRGVADLAKEKGVDLTTVTGAMEAARKAAFDEMVAAGTLTREQADQMLDHMGKAGFLTLNGAAMMQAGGGCHGAAPKSN